MRLFNRKTRIIVALIAGVIGFFVALKAKETAHSNVQTSEQAPGLAKETTTAPDR